ncbi:APC family permease [Lacrimispora indolis]|uniref:APC family permease n=1 Tax=Lacrimispora indolis TaxID=69825 RepID=UPI00045EA39E|nr:MULTISPECIES: APC family permease [Lachnospiraceae]MBE7718668.1 APC family permease [Lacrimispora celerecrescens]
MSDSQCSSSTKQLKQVLGFWDLMGASVGQIIGAGIMTLLGAAIAMTGRSVPLAFLVAAIITVCQYLPVILISGTVRLRGGQYTMVAMLTGEKFAGAYTIMFIFSNLSISMYGLSFASYFISLFGIGNEKVIALAILTLFYVLNCFGIDKFARIQNLIVMGLILALGVFAAFGVGDIEPGYFAESTFMTGGMLGLLQAGGLLTFAVGGASCIVNLSAESKRPTRDIPLVMIISTLAVAVLYGIIAFVAAGVLPLEQVAGQNLTLVADKILSRPLYIFFIVCGAGFALISTLNAQYAWAPKPVMQACDDGWLPARLARLSKYNTPIIILTILYLVAAVCILTGLSVAVLGNMCLIANGVITLMINICVYKIPKVCPEAWENSKFKVGKSAMTLITALGAASAIFAIILNASTLSTTLILLNVVVIAGSFVFSFLRSKQAHVEVSYEEA